MRRIFIAHTHKKPIFLGGGGGTITIKNASVEILMETWVRMWFEGIIMEVWQPKIGFSIFLSVGSKPNQSASILSTNM